MYPSVQPKGEGVHIRKIMRARDTPMQANSPGTIIYTHSNTRQNTESII